MFVFVSSRVQSCVKSNVMESVFYIYISLCVALLFGYGYDKLAVLEYKKIDRFFMCAE